MRLSKKHIALLCTFTILNFSSNYTSAQESDNQSASSESESLQTYDLDNVVVTATKRPQSSFDANANISVITKDDI